MVALRQEILDAPVLDEDLLRQAKHYGLSDRIDQAWSVPCADDDLSCLVY
nr:hypothetical protein [Nocardia neocaledoniensis]